MVGQMYVEMRIPQNQTHPYPIVMLHGGTRSGTTFTGTPDGREGWAQYFARRGYAVYVVDQPGRGRSGYAEAYGPSRVADGESAQRRYLQQSKYKSWPQAHLHTQWPGSGEPDDPVTQQMIGGFLPEIENSPGSNSLPAMRWWRCSTAIGPAILLTHSQAAPSAGRSRMRGRISSKPSSASSRTGRRCAASNSSVRLTGSRRATEYRSPTALRRCR